MTPPKASAIKKDEVIQLRVEKSFLDHLTETAEKQQLPLSVMIRTWLAEKLREQDSIENAKRDKWRYQRIEQILKNHLFDEGPLLIVQAFPLGNKTRMDVEKLRLTPYNLVPAYARTNMEVRIIQAGLEVTRTWKDRKICAQGLAYKTGETETVICLESEKPKLYIDSLDVQIVTAVHSLCSLLKNNALPMPYLVHIYVLKAKDYAAWESTTRFTTAPPDLFTSDLIELPEVIITDADQLLTEAHTGEFIIDQIDELWNAAGLPCSKSYDTARKWVHRS